MMRRAGACCGLRGACLCTAARRELRAEPSGPSAAVPDWRARLTAAAAAPPASFAPRSKMFLRGDSVILVLRNPK